MAARKEPATGSSFAEKSHDFAGKTLHLLGAGFSFSFLYSSTGVPVKEAGVRERKVGFMTVKAFALGLYIDDEGLQLLHRFKGNTASQLEKSEDFYKQLMTGNFSKQLEMILQRDATGEDFGKNLQETLKPGVLAHGGSGADLDKLNALFKGKTMKSGAGIFMATRTPGVLEVGLVEDASKLEPPAAPLGSVESPPVVAALFENYLGPKAVSPSAKSAFAAGAASLLATV
ncbi:Chalcone-flavanone isomerase family protein [Klebsormidium nitens]|uniref:Chalcone-flavonone isomerase family protein n=1 Tax=Klebsormidium nitens TaxID=105231 RepID=A0A1Y1I1M2_KLENI|nr:Chalcone-flavanone isomerase family protein [Klebsormidium nitens]|eukprot:GAQ84814.1 Chalcone-flavanone isomerase family protein [Klebsormidium nitens]